MRTHIVAWGHIYISMRTVWVSEWVTQLAERSTYASSVLILLYTSPHTTMYMSSYCTGLYLCPHTTTCIFIVTPSPQKTLIVENTRVLENTRVQKTHAAQSVKKQKAPPKFALQFSPAVEQGDAGHEGACYKCVLIPLHYYFILLLQFTAAVFPAVEQGDAGHGGAYYI